MDYRPMPKLPIDLPIGRFNGGQGDIWVSYTVEEPDDYLSEDEMWGLTDEVMKNINECAKLVDEDDFDVYDYFRNLCVSIPTHGPNLRFN